MEGNTAHSRGVNHSGVLGRKLKDGGQRYFCFFQQMIMTLKEKGIFIYTALIISQVHLLYMENTTVFKPPTAL